MAWGSEHGPPLASIDEARRRAGGSGPRVPPHDLGAEESLLGAMLLDAGAATSALAALGQGDYYSPAHGHVHGAIGRVVAAGTPVDAVTVADELRRAGVLDAIGGPAELVSMQAHCPAITNAAAYAAIVAECARARRVIAAAGELAEAGYGQDWAAAGAALARAGEGARGPAGALVVEDLCAGDDGIAPLWLHRRDGAALIYPGLLHWVSGVPASGKTWLALLAVLSAVRAGRSTVYVDYEGSRRIMAARLRSLGASDAELAMVAYARPSGLSSTVGPVLAALVATIEAAVVVLDGVAKALARDGADEDRAPQVLAWMESMVWPVTAGGAAMVLLDHVTKDADSRGRWMRGSGAKLGEVDGAAYSLEVRQPWSRTRAGYSAVRLTKDREGVIGANDEVVGLLHFRPKGGMLDCSIELPAATTTAQGTAGTPDIADVVRSVVGAMAPGATVSQSGLEALVRDHGSWRHEVVRETAARLADAGEIVRERHGQRWRIGPVVDPLAGLDPMEDESGWS